MTTLVIFAIISAAISVFYKKDIMSAVLIAVVMLLGLLATIPHAWGWTLVFAFLFASTASGIFAGSKKCPPEALLAVAVALILFPIRWEWESFISLISWFFGVWAVVVSLLK